MHPCHVKPGSPGDILEHHGTKGMKWGVRNEEETSGQSTAQRNETEKAKIAEGLTSGTPTRPREKQEHNQHSGLSSNQKKAIFAAGVGVVAVGGFIAYKHYAGGNAPSVRKDLTDLGNPFPKKADMSGLKTGPLSQNPLGAMGKKGEYALYRQEGLSLDTSRGYANWKPIGGFANEAVAARHDSMIRALEAMREQYPAIRNMNIEIAPMSHATFLPESSALALAMQMGNGEARLYYNDISGAASTTEAARAFISGVADPDSLGTHEMGHILAIANGSLLGSGTLDSIREQVRENFSDHDVVNEIHQVQDRFHKQLFTKHGMSFEELSKLSGYAATSPVEALGELSANYHSPKLRAQMSPELRRKAEAMFNEMGGLS